MIGEHSSADSFSRLLWFLPDHPWVTVGSRERKKESTEAMAERRLISGAVTQKKRVAPAKQGTYLESAVRIKSKDFNPKLIFSQIVSMQCFHYVFLGFIFQVNHVLFNTAVTIDRVFTGKYLNLWSMKGLADNIAILLSYLFG